jgi:hypothetical protein
VAEKVGSTVATPLLGPPRPAPATRAVTVERTAIHSTISLLTDRPEGAGAPSDAETLDQTTLTHVWLPPGPRSAKARNSSGTRSAEESAIAA